MINSDQETVVSAESEDVDNVARVYPIKAK